MLKVKALIALSLFLTFSFVITGCGTIFSVDQGPEATETAEEGKLPEWLLSEHRQFEVAQAERDEEPLKPKDQEEDETVETQPRKETVAQQETIAEDHNGEGTTEKTEAEDDTSLSAREILAGKKSSDNDELTKSQKLLAEKWAGENKDSDNGDNNNDDNWWEQ